MKNIFKYAYSLLAGVVALTAVSCSDKYEYDGRGSWDATSDYANIYFSTTDSVIELDPTEATQAKIKVKRKNTSGALEVPFEVVKNTDNVFEVGKASFADGADEAEFVINFPNAEIGTPYALQLTLKDPALVSKYSKGISYTLSLTRVKWNSLGMGTIAEGFYLGYDANVEIQQRDDKPSVFRIIKPLDDILAQDLEDYPEDAPYMNGLQPDKIVFTVLKPGDVVSEDVYDAPVTVKGNDLVDYNTYHLGFTNSSYGEPVKCYHPKSMKSTADEASWSYNKVLSYQADGKTPGQVQFAPFYYMDGVGGWNNTQSNGIVVITFPGYTPLYTATVEDYNWEKVFAGAYISAQLGTTTEGVTLYKGVAKADVEAENPGCYDRFAELYGTPYLIKDAYAEGYDIVFGVKDGEVKVIEGYESQPLGIQAVGADVYGAIGAGGSSFTAAVVNLKITFQNKKGDVEYGTAVETLANLSWSEVGTGVYTYGVEALSQTGSSYYEGSENATLFQCNELPENYIIKPWAMSEDGLKFTLSAKDGKIRFYQYTGEAYENYGDVYFIDLEAYNPAYTEYLGEYNEESKTFEFCGAYFIPAAGGGFGLVSETFVLDAPAAAPKAVKKNKGLKQAFKHYQIPSRFQPKSALKIEEMAK
ncbi:MAG: hypothetical protein J6T05_01395 [Prevotella sp.]|nr:hypothetical protein [Prevotella sp.]